MKDTTILNKCSHWKEHKKCIECPKGANYLSFCPLIKEWMTEDE